MSFWSLFRGKHSSRIEEEAQEVKKKSAEIEQKIKQLSAQISNPKKYFGDSKDDKRAQSTVEHFRRYFMLDQSMPVEKRKPTRAELRAERIRAIFWAVVAFFLLILIIGNLRRFLH